MKQLVVKSLSQAMKMVKEMDVHNSHEWSVDYREFGRHAIADFLQYRMKESISDHLPALMEYRTRETGDIFDTS
jgi:hypothetical protein